MHASVRSLSSMGLVAALGFASACAPRDVGRDDAVVDLATAGTTAPSAARHDTNAQATASPTAACQVGALRLEMDPMSIAGAPPPNGPQTLLSMADDGQIDLALAPGKALFALDDAGCLTFEKKLVAEILPDGHIISVRGEPIGSLSGRTLTLTTAQSTIEIAADGRMTQTPSPGLPDERFIGLDPNEVCAAAMLIVALGESVSGASMAVVDGVAKRPPVQPSPPGSRCANVAR